MAYLQKWIFGWGLISKFGISLMVGTKTQHTVLKQLNQKDTRLFCKGNLVGNNDIFLIIIITKFVFLFAFLSSIKGFNTVQLLFYRGFLETWYYSAIMLPSNRAPGGLFLRVLSAKMIFSWGFTQEGGLFRGGDLFKDLQYVA